MNAALYSEPPVRKKGEKGRPLEPGGDVPQLQAGARSRRSPEPSATSSGAHRSLRLPGLHTVIVWFAEAGEFRLKEYRRRRPWYRKKETPSFADMLEDIRREISARGVSVAPGAKKGRRKNAA